MCKPQQLIIAVDWSAPSTGRWHSTTPGWTVKVVCHDLWDLKSTLLSESLKKVQIRLIILMRNYLCGSNIYCYQRSCHQWWLSVYTLRVKRSSAGKVKSVMPSDPDLDSLKHWKCEASLRGLTMWNMNHGAEKGLQEKGSSRCHFPYRILNTIEWSDVMVNRSAFQFYSDIRGDWDLDFIPGRSTPPSKPHADKDRSLSKRD